MRTLSRPTNAAAAWLLALALPGCALSVAPSAQDNTPAANPCGEYCVARPIAPLSTSTVTTQRPTLRWQLPGDTDGARVELCRDDSCSDVITTLDVTGSRVTVADDLPRGPVYWRVTARRDGALGTRPSPVWQFRVGARSAPVDTSWGAALDANRDGLMDAISARPGALSTDHEYVVEVYPGAPTWNLVDPMSRLHARPGQGSFGRTVANAGDLNGDGYPDLAVGAWSTTVDGMQYAGAVVIYLGYAGGYYDTPAQVLRGSFERGNFGASIAGIGDVNGDGYADLAVGAPGASPGGREEAGTVSIYLGNYRSVTNYPNHVFEGARAGDQFGQRVASAGDVNGDGFGDFAVSSPFSGAARTDRAGATHVFLGGEAALASLRATILPGASVTDFSGSNLACAGDVNGDGYADLLIGVADPVTNRRAVRLHMGSAEGLAVEPARVLESTAPESIGAHLATAGDVNGDGYADVISSESVAVDTDTFAARARVFLGSPSGLSSEPASVLLGRTSASPASCPVTGGGDANGDGYDDVIFCPPTEPGAPATMDEAVALYAGSAEGVSASPARVLEPAGRRP